ncbi:proliferation associated protein [Polychytrium aggregatum]|uniref:proliferation associated protein n=1 Tax=Polychytrium aggregatum TaxID=110093 RepID=UPI0022FF2FFA|nr:proliferation associated protein [Polychytrium aggregatum]KAI9209287.1 proliferation associated protein [Polychytrium aggregatum]
MDAMELYRAERMEEDNFFSDNVVTKYRTAADLANETMKTVAAACVAGRKIVDICRLGDDMILDMTSKVFKKSGVERGIAFPTSLNINNVVKNFSPFPEDETTLNAGDVVKIELGVHIDGYIAVLGHTVIVNPQPQTPITGRAADVVCAAHYAAEAAARIVQPGMKSHDLVEAIQRVAAAFNCRVVEGVETHLMKRYVLQAPVNTIPGQPTLESLPDDFVFEEHQAYSVNIVMTSGSGKAKSSDDPRQTLILQRDANQTYNLKLKAARAALSVASETFGFFPFATRTLLDMDPRHKLGLQEPLQHQILIPHSTLYEDRVHESEQVVSAQFRFTILLLPSGPLRITIGQETLPLPYVHSNYELEPAGISELLKRQGARMVKSKLPAMKQDNSMEM